MPPKRKRTTQDPEQNKKHEADSYFFFLPVEIVDWILQHIPRRRKDWLNVKLTCKRFLVLSRRTFKPIKTESLRKMIVRNNCHAVKSLIQNEGEFHNVKIYGESVLVDALFMGRGDGDIVRFYVKNGLADYEDFCSDLFQGRFLLPHRDDEVAKMLDIVREKWEAPPHFYTDLWMKLMRRSIRMSSHNMLAALLKFDSSMKDEMLKNTGHELLSLAVESSRLETLRILLGCKLIEPHYMVKFDGDPFMNACWTGSAPHVAEFLKDDRVNPSAHEGRAMSLDNVRKDLLLMRLLLERSRLNDYGEHYRRGPFTVLMYVMDRPDFDVNQVWHKGDSSIPCCPLDMAASACQANALEAMLAREDCNPNIMEGSPLISAIGWQPGVEMLLEHPKMNLTEPRIRKCFENERASSVTVSGILDSDKCRSEWTVGMIEWLADFFVSSTTPIQSLLASHPKTRVCILEHFVDEGEMVQARKAARYLGAALSLSIKKGMEIESDLSPSLIKLVREEMDELIASVKTDLKVTVKPFPTEDDSEDDSDDDLLSADVSDQSESEHNSSSEDEDKYCYVDGKRYKLDDEDKYRWVNGKKYRLDEA